jgi:hypothetical protein
MERRFLVDDIDRTTMEGVEEVRFGLEGVEFRIDLSEVHIKELREMLLPFMRAARREGGPSRIPDGLRAVLGDAVPPRTAGPAGGNVGARRKRTADEIREVRAFAEEHHIHIGPGRLPRDVVGACKANDPNLVDPKRRRPA